MGRLEQVVLTGALLLLSGCHQSAFVAAELRNNTSNALSVVEVDYPNASFGTQSLAPGAVFRYRFKVLGSGPMKLTYTDQQGHDHTATGPTLKEGASGSLMIRIAPAEVSWEPHLAPER